MSDSAEMKKLAGETAAGQVKDGMTVGLGTGSTVFYTVLKLGAMVREGLNISGIPTSKATEKLALEQGIKLGTLAEYPSINLTIDGADEVDPSFNLIKGMGGALLREKVVASVSERMTVIVDDSKMVEKLGTRSPLPVEVVPFALSTCLSGLEKLCCEAVVRQVDGETYLTDNGNNIVDCHFEGIEDPIELDGKLFGIPGVVENGLFLGLATTVVVGTPEGVKVLQKPI
jgi:ribose 5-phosphate isomerase A